MAENTAKQQLLDEQADQINDSGGGNADAGPVETNNKKYHWMMWRMKNN